MEVYTIKDEDLTQVPERAIEYERDLQSHLLKARGAKIGEIRMMYVSQEETPDEEGGFFDILGVNENGDTVIVELKRGKSPRLVVSQALEYASGIRKEEYDRLDERFRAFRQSRSENSDTSLREAHTDFFKLNDPLAEREFNDAIHIVVVAAEFDNVTLNMADLLREHELDVVCVRYQTFADTDEDLTLLTTETVRQPLALEPSGSTGDSTLTDTEVLQEEFWQQLVEKLDQPEYSEFYTEAAKPRSYLPVQGTLPAGADIALGTDSHRGQLQVKLHLRDETTDMYDTLLEHRSDIESAIDPGSGEEFIWDPDSAGYEQIRLVRDGNIKTGQEQWDEFHNWLLHNWMNFDEVVGSYLHK